MQINGGLLEHMSLNEPVRCEKCGSMEIKYNGVGEYACKACGFLMYDDYGKVRNYIEQNPGATANEVSIAVGVSKEKIRRLLREDKIQIAPGSATFLRCDVCGADIRSGKLCIKCAAEAHKEAAAQKIASRVSAVHGGFSKNTTAQSSGAKRFDKK